MARTISRWLSEPSSGRSPVTEHIYERRMQALQRRMSDHGIGAALITDEDSIYYFSGYHSYLYMDFGRPTFFVLSADGDAAIITPAMEIDMALRMGWVDDIRPWQDGVSGEWRGPLDAVLNQLGGGTLGVDLGSTPPVVRDYIEGTRGGAATVDLGDLIADIRMIKCPQEIQLARHAGQVAEAMMEAGRQSIGEGVPEYEVAISTMSAGTRKAAELLEAHYDDELMSPNAHFLQIMASGSDTTMPHHRASTKRLKRGEPVFLCFCGMTNFRRFKLGFDRMFWVGEVADSRHEAVYEVAIASQRAALGMIRPGVRAEAVHAAYAEVIQSAGYAFPFRCGRATGSSFLEKPQITFGDETELRPGMVLAVDGSVNVPDLFRAQVGDSIVVTDQGYEPLTNYPKAIEEMVVG
jgi:Xaa-Pro dipeptidase